VINKGTKTADAKILHALNNITKSLIFEMPLQIYFGKELFKVRNLRDLREICMAMKIRNKREKIYDKTLCSILAVDSTFSPCLLKCRFTSWNEKTRGTHYIIDIAHFNTLRKLALP